MLLAAGFIENSWCVSAQLSSDFWSKSWQTMQTSLDRSLGNPSKMISGCFTNKWSFTLRKMKFHQQCPGFAKRCVSTVSTLKSFRYSVPWDHLWGIGRLLQKRSLEIVFRSAYAGIFGRPTGLKIGFWSTSCQYCVIIDSGKAVHSSFFMILTFFWIFKKQSCLKVLLEGYSHDKCGMTMLHERLLTWSIVSRK